MENLYLIANVAGQRIAINAADVESVVKTGNMIPVPKTNPRVAGLFAMRSRVLTMIDCQFCAVGTVTSDTLGAPAIVICVGAHYFGLLVEKVSDVIDTANCVRHPVPRLASGWAQIVTGLIELDDGPVMVIDIANLVGNYSEQRAA